VTTVHSDSNANSDFRAAGRAQAWLTAACRFVASLATRTFVLVSGATVIAAACHWGPFDEGARATARATLLAHSCLVQSIAFRPDGMLLSSVGVDGSVVISNTDSPPDNQPMPPAQGSVCCAAFSPDGGTIAVASTTAPVALLDLRSRCWHDLGDSIGSSPRATSLAFAPDGTTCAVAELGGRVSLWDVTNGRRFSTLCTHPDYIAALAFAPDGQTLAVSGRDRGVRIWDLPAGREHFLFANPGAATPALVFSPDGRLLVLADRSRPVVRLWDITTLTERAILSSPAGVVTSVAISPDGRTLAAASSLGSVSFWNLATLELSPKRLRDAGVRALAFAPGGQTLATGGRHGAILLWDWPIRDDG
jgi:WD40 repeat protein